MAYYDMKPSKYEAVGNGSYIYRWNIQEVSAPESSDGGQRTQWQCEEVIVWPPVSSNKITEAVVSHLWPSNYEQKLINEYNAANLGVYGENDSPEAHAKVERYTDFLTQRAAIKAQIDADCSELGI